MATTKPRFLKKNLEAWDTNPENLHKTVLMLEIQHQSRLVLSRCLLRQYWNRPIIPRSFADMDAVDLQRFAFALEQIMSQLGWNVTRQIVDAAAARICRPLACKIITVGGDAKLQQQCAKKTRLIDGLNEELSTLSVNQRAFIDACTCEVGGVLPYFDTDASEIRQRRVDPMGIFWHNEEGEQPRRLYLVEAVARDTMMDLASSAQARDAIAEATSWKRPIITGVESATAESTLDTVKVSTGWKTARGTRKGRYVVAVGNVVIEDREYEHEHHQLCLLRWAPDFRGAGGVALGRLLTPYHRWLNQLTQICYGSLRGAVPHVLRHESTEINNLSDMPFQDLTWSGTQAPVMETPNPVSEQIMQHMQLIPQQAGIEAGVNASIAAGQKPVGINSQPALREYIDFADSRLALANDAWKKLWSDEAKVYIGLCAEHYKDQSVVVRAPGSAFLEEIRWKDVDMRKNRYRVQFALTSGLGNSVSGKMQKMDDAKNLGIGDSIEYMRALKDDLPDFAAFADRATAPRDLAIRMCEQALEGEYVPPSPLMGPDGLNAIELIGSQLYSKAQLDKNHTPEQLETLRKLIRAAQRKKAPPLPTVQPVPTGAPFAPGMIQPVGAVAPAAPPTLQQ